jgi:predicted ester cyclase
VSEKNKAVVRSYYEEVFNQGNVAKLDEIFAPNFVGHAPSGTYGLAEVRHSIAQEHATFPTSKVIVDDQIAEGEKVVTLWRYVWTHDRPAFGAPPTGKETTLQGVQFDRVVDGRIVERWEVKDLLGAFKQLGGKVVFPGASEAGDT